MNESFVVGFRRDEVVRRRAILRRKRKIGGSATLFFAAIAIGGWLWQVLTIPEFRPFGAIAVAGMLPLVIVASKTLKQTADTRWYDATELPPYAMRMTPVALELGIEGAPAPVILPWSAVVGVRQQRRQLALVVVLQPGITSSSPGVSGLDQPAIRAALRRIKRLKTFGFYGVPILDQPVEAIDQALRHFSNGAAAVVP